MKTDAPKKINLSDYSPYPWEIENVYLEFDLYEEATIVTSKINFLQKDGCEEKTAFLNGKNLKIIALKIDDRELNENDYLQNEEGLELLNLPKKFVFEAKVEINPKANTALSGLYISGGRFCTQCEAEGFRRITFWPDRPDVMSIFTVKAIADKNNYPTILINGNCIEEGFDGSDRHYAIWQDPWRKPCYLFALVAGELEKIEDSFKTKDGRNVKLGIYVDKGNSSKALYAMDSLKNSMKWDEDVFNCIYDLDVFNIVAVRDFNFGAMENKGLNIFNSTLLLADEVTATDFDYGRIESVIAHEYFHNWSGNRVTCRDWFQLSLKEGLTVYRDQEFSADMRSRDVQRIFDVNALRSRQFAEDKGPNAHSVRPTSYASIDNFYTATIYEKGAEIIRVAQNLLGKERFLDGAKNYFKTNDGKAATIEDWLAALRNGEPVLEGIEKWYAQAGTPKVEVFCDYDEKSQIFKMNLNQSTPDTPNQSGKKWVPIPIRFGFINENGAPIELSTQNPCVSKDLIDFSSENLEIIFKNVKTKPIPSLLRGFSAPVILETNISRQDKMILARHDIDGFNKYENLRNLLIEEIKRLYSCVDNSNPASPDAQIVEIVSEIANNAQKDFAFASLCLGLPNVNDMMQHISQAKPENIFAAREILMKAIGEHGQNIFSNYVIEYDFNQEFKTDAKSAGQRDYLASCLNYLSTNSLNTQLLSQTYDNAKNMSDSFASLSALSRINKNEYHDRLRHFAAKWRENPLVMDKWFALQASSPWNDPLAKLEILLNDKDFDLKNPNRVRSVIGAFAMNNPVGFHASNGQAYEKIADLIEQIDAINSNVAARTCTAFERVIMVEDNRKKLAKASLNKLLEGKISVQTREIAAQIAITI